MPDLLTPVFAELPKADIAVLLIYVIGITAFGCGFIRKSSNTSEFMSAGGSLPGWAVGLSIFGTYLSSNTFLGVPGKSYGSNWNSFVLSLSLPIAALITGVDNPSARSFADREHFHAVYFGAKNKTAAIEALCREHNLSSEQLLCLYDDVNDLGMAFGCGIRVLVKRDASEPDTAFEARSLGEIINNSARKASPSTSTIVQPFFDSSS